HYEGDVVKRDYHMLASVLDLAEREIGEVMTHRKNIISLNININKKQLLAKILECNHTRIPIWQKKPENIIGILHTRELFQALTAQNGDITKVDIRAILMEPWFVPETATLVRQLMEFRKRRHHMAL